MSKPDRSRVIRVTEAQARIPGPAGEHAVAVFRRGPLDIALSLPQRPNSYLLGSISRTHPGLMLIWCLPS